MKKILDFINKFNVRRKALYALILGALFTAVTIFGAVTYARFYTSYNEALQAQVAKYAFSFENDSLKRTEKESGTTEVVTISDRKAQSLEINEIKPEDVI